MRLVVTSGYPTSLHAIALIHQLAARGHDVVGCMTVRIFNPRRVRAYLRQLGPRKLWKKVHAAILSRAREPESVAAEIAPVLEFLQASGISSRNVKQACASVGARMMSVSSLNSPAALEQLRSLGVDLVVYAGGGILRKAFLETSRLGVLNAHGGPLPPIRGMNASEWALFHGVDPTVTMHLMDTGIDTGPMIMHRPIPTESWRSSIARGRGEAARVGVEGLLDAVDLLAKGTVEPTPQSYGDGRQYFIIADPLLEVLERWIADGRTPVMDAATFRFPAPAADWCKSKQT